MTTTAAGVMLGAALSMQASLCQLLLGRASPLEEAGEMVSLSEGQIVGRVVTCILVSVGTFVLLALVGSARKWTYQRYIPVGVALATIYTVVLCRVVLLPWTITLTAAVVATAIMSFIMIVRARVGEPVRGALRRKPRGVHHDQH